VDPPGKMPSSMAGETLTATALNREPSQEDKSADEIQVKAVVPIILLLVRLSKPFRAE